MPFNELFLKNTVYNILLNTAEYGVTLGSTAVNSPPPASSLSAVSRIEIESAALARQMSLIQSMPLPDKI